MPAAAALAPRRKPLIHFSSPAACGRPGPPIPCAQGGPAPPRRGTFFRRLPMHTIRLLAALLAVAVLFAGRAPAAQKDGTIGIDEVAENTGGKGVVVKKLSDGPAKAAGIKEDDVIYKVGSTNITTPDEFNSAIKNARPGSK